MDGIADGLFRIWFELDGELDGLRVCLPIICGFLFDHPIDPTIKMFNDADFDRFLFVVSQRVFS